MSRVAIIQSSYIPWRGYFAAIAACDVFVYFDSVQFTRRDWRTRNAVKTAQGVHWLSVPVTQKGHYHAPIDQIRIAETGWWRGHLKTIEMSYRRAAHFNDVFPFVASLFEAIDGQELLSEINQHMTAAICTQLGIQTRLLRDVDILPAEDMAAMDPTLRLARLCSTVGADVYLSGPAAKAYLDERVFHEVGAAVEWIDYRRFAIPYAQLWGEFAPAVSIIDTLLNTGFDQTREIVYGDNQLARQSAS
jgi:hypothetical protein